MGPVCAGHAADRRGLCLWKCHWKGHTEATSWRPGNVQLMSWGFILNVSGKRGVRACHLLKSLEGRVEVWSPQAPAGVAPAAEVQGRGGSSQRKAREEAEGEASGTRRGRVCAGNWERGGGPGGRELSILSPVTSSVSWNRTGRAQEKGRLRIKLQDSSRKYARSNGNGNVWKRRVPSSGWDPGGHLTGKRGWG